MAQQEDREGLPDRAAPGDGGSDAPHEPSVIDRWANPTTLRGAAFVVGGLVILAFPSASQWLITTVIGAVLIVTGLSHLWGAVRRRPVVPASIGLGVIWVAAGVVIVLFAREAIDLVVTILGLLAVVRGVLIVWRTLSARPKADSWIFDTIRGLLFVAAGSVIAVLPSALTDAVLVVGAVGFLVIGGILVSSGTSDSEASYGATELGGLVVRWVRARDVGDEMRDEVIDNLYFEPPDSTQKQVGFWVLLVLSVIIATLGVIADSTAVVIGAMLVAPLMTPIMGVSAGIVNGWVKRIATSFATVAGGVGVAVMVAFVVAVWTPQLVPIAANAQIQSRISPTMVDLLIAVAAGAAGAYATVDRRVSSSITGVAIAVALVPPLGVVGVMIQASDYSDALGAFLLFATNLVSIILAASLVFVITGLAPFDRVRQSHRDVRTVVSSVLLGTIVIMVPLVFTSEGILSAATRQGQAQEATQAWLADADGISLDRVSVQGEDVSVVVSGEGDLPPVADLESALEESIGADVSVTVEYFPATVVTSDSS